MSFLRLSLPQAKKHLETFHHQIASQEFIRSANKAKQKYYDMKVRSSGFLVILQISLRVFESQHKFTTKLLTPRPLPHGVMSSSSTSSSADYREKRAPPPGKRTGAAGPPLIGAIEAFPPLPVTRETQYRETSSSPSMPETEKEKEKNDVPMTE